MAVKMVMLSDDNPAGIPFSSSTSLLKQFSVKKYTMTPCTKP